MKPDSPKNSIKAYASRWKLVNAAERRELQRTSFHQKFIQLNSLFVSVKQLGWDESMKAGEEEVWERWNKLRKFYHAKG